jgi:hypothetical protein
MNLREKLAQKKAAQQGTGSKLAGLKNRMGSQLAANKTSGGSSLRNKFKKRNQSILEKTYEERNERSKAGGGGRPIFNQELMQEFGIEDFKTVQGDRFVELLPISFEDNIPYFKEISVHFGVGFNQDAFICVNRLNNGRCFRCEFQNKMWRDQVTYTKDDAKKLYPLDRCVYLLWERTKELVDGESPDYTFQLWAAPKTKVHGEIQARVRNKITGKTLDLSDVSENGDGRTISFTIKKNKGEFPEYRAFDLLERDMPIPDEVIEKLDQIISYAIEQGYNNCIEMFYNIPDYDEIKESMETEMDDEPSANKGETTGSVRKSLKPDQSSATPSTTGSTSSSDEDAIMEILEEKQAEMEQAKANPLKWRKWCKDNDYEDAISMNVDEAIPAIIDDMYEKMLAELNG